VSGFLQNGGIWLRSGAYVVVFLVCVLALAKLQSTRARQIVLLLASFGLYLSWVPWFGLVLLGSIVTNYLIGRWLRRKNSWPPLAAGIVLNLFLLGVFKYLPELGFHFTSSPPHARSQLALPLGISFWTFQALSYLFDLYSGEELDPSFVEFTLYMAFFPVTIAGPVCRMPAMLPQFRSQETTTGSAILHGLRRIAVGALMMQFAKLLGQGILAGDGIVSGFDRSTQWSGADAWCLAMGYGLQLFLDFAGYTHIAVGAAQALGITVPENFERPFASTTPSMFWSRWHISLSFWVRDYVFFPLAVLRRELWWRNLMLVVSMALFGIWHRASLLFLIWGCYHGLLLVSHRVVQQVERKFDWQPSSGLWTAFSWLVTMAMISLGWIFFRAHSLSQAGQMLAAMASPRSYASHFLSTSLYALVFIVAAGYALVTGVTRALEREIETPAGTARSPMLALIARWRWFWIPAVYALALLFVLMITLTQEGGAGQLMYRSF
jgi:alginate O-acetyltransferase complex protein AlgI